MATSKPVPLLRPLLLLLLCLAAPLAAAAPSPQFTWMYGLQGPGGLESAVSLGLNTLYLPTTNTADSLEDTQRLVRTAHARGVQVIIALPTFSQEERSADPDSADYRDEVGGRMRAVVRFLREEPGVTAWAMGDYPERELRLSPTGWEAFLQQRYRTLEALNAAWGTQVPDWGEATLAAAHTADAKLPYGVGRASVDAADYQADALRRLLVFWAEQVRLMDPDRPLFTGRLALYRSLVSVPAAYRYVTPEAPVDVLEPDTVSQNVQAVDMARQAGAFEVVPSLRVPVPPEPHFLRGATLVRWIQEAQLHGARGVALDGVDRISGCSAPEAVLAALQAAVQASAGGFTVQPRARLAVLYEPYAEGRQAQEVSTYGYLGGLVPGEPSLLISGLRLGSRFGLVDYLSLERLLAADLDGYSAILAPCALSLPVEAQAKLRTYVERGGRLVCDFGAGVQQTGSWQVLPEELARLCGIESLGHMHQQAGDLTFAASTALFPSLVPPLVSQPQVEQKPLVNDQTQQTQGTPLQLKSWTFSGPMVMATLSDDTRAVGIVTAQAQSGQEPARFSGLMARPDGPGWAAFCTGSLWARWSPADPAFAVTHGDLWAPRAEYALQQPGLWPGAVEMCAGDGIVWLLNCTAQPLSATVLAWDSDCSLYAGTFAWLPLAAGGTTTAELLADLPAGGLSALARRPVQVSPLAGGAFAHLEAYGTGQIRLELAGPGASLVLGLNHQRTFNPGAPLQVMVSVSDGDYAVAPGSRHRVQIDAGFGQRADTIQQADARGTLTFPVSGAHAEVEITPAP